MFKYFVLITGFPGKGGILCANQGEMCDITGNVEANIPLGSGKMLDFIFGRKTNTTFSQNDWRLLVMEDFNLGTL